MDPAVSLNVLLVNGKSINGRPFCVDPTTGTIVLEHAPADGSFSSLPSYTMISPIQVASVDGNLGILSAAEISAKGVNIAALEKYEQKAQMAAERSIAGLNHSVSADVQSLYDKLALLFSDCRWEDNNTICILDEFLIYEPYDTVTVRPGSDVIGGLDRVQKVLEGERRKLGFV